MNSGAAKRIELLNYALGGVATLVAFLICDQPQALGLFLGALISALNFSVIRQMTVPRIDAARRGRPDPGSLLPLPKMLALLLAVAFAVLFLPISVPFLAVGFAIFLVSIAIETVRFLTNPPDEANSTGGNRSGSQSNG